jgi:hypothetical protein
MYVILTTALSTLSVTSFLLSSIVRLIDGGNQSSLNFDYNYAQFPHPELQPEDVISTAGPIFFFGSLMFNFVIQVAHPYAISSLYLFVHPCLWLGWAYRWV